MKKKISVYTAIAYLITWSIAFTVAGLFSRGMISENTLNLLHSLAAIGPAAAATIATFIFYGVPGLKRLLKTIRFKKPDNQTVFFILSPVMFFGIGLIVYRIIRADWYSFDDFAAINWDTSVAFLGWLLPLLTYAFFEEIGWRGFLLPHLQEKYTAWRSTIYLTIIWALWHIPFFFYRFVFSPGISVGFFFGIFVGAIILTSIYNSSRGALVPVMLFHFLNNLCSAFDQEIVVAVLSTGFVFLAVQVYRTRGRTNLSNQERIRNYLQV